MSGSSITVLEIILLEVIIILVPITAFFAYKFFKKSSPASKSNFKASDFMAHFASYINENIITTDKKLAETSSDENKDQHDLLTVRLNTLKSELDILTYKNDNEADGKDYWTHVVDEYTKHHQHDADSTAKEQVYATRIKNLESFKEMYLQSQLELAESKETIQKLSDITDKDENINSEELTATIQKLEEENKALQEKLKSDGGDLDTAIDSIKTDTQTGSAEMDNLKDENEFLCQQIEHLLKQELESSQQMVEKLGSLEVELNEKNAENEVLINKLAENNITL